MELKHIDPNGAIIWASNPIFVSLGKILKVKLKNLFFIFFILYLKKKNFACPQHKTLYNPHMNNPKWNGL